MSFHYDDDENVARSQVSRHDNDYSMNHEGCVVSNQSKMNEASGWIDLKIPPSELRCENTLEIGQTFGWVNISNLGNSMAPPRWVPPRWIGVIGEHVVMLESTETTRAMILDSVAYPTAFPSADFPLADRSAKVSGIDSVRHYLRLDIPTSSLATLYSEWSSNCEFFRKVADVIPGTRILRQEIFETLISFVVSQNNNVSRITQILAKIRKRFGRKIMLEEGTRNWMLKWIIHDVWDTKGPGFACVEELLDNLYTFPTVQEFIDHNPSIEELYEIGLGYRAKYIRKILDQLKEVYGNPHSVIQDTAVSGNPVRIPLSVETPPTDVDAESASYSSATASGARNSSDQKPQSRNNQKLREKLTQVPKEISKLSETKSKAEKEVPPSIPLENLILPDRLSSSSKAADGISLTDQNIVQELTRYHGIGRKVAECIALFACNCLDLVPVDTHVLQLAEKLGIINDVKEGTKAGSYDVIHKGFQKKYGRYVGWAHSVLFAGELPQYKKILEVKYGKDWGGVVKPAGGSKAMKKAGGSKAIMKKAGGNNAIMKKAGGNSSMKSAMKSSAKGRGSGKVTQTTAKTMTGMKSTKTTTSMKAMKSTPGMKAGAKGNNAMTVMKTKSRSMAMKTDPKAMKATSVSAKSKAMKTVAMKIAMKIVAKSVSKPAMKL